jgi:hypothetical protein
VSFPPGCRTEVGVQHHDQDSQLIGSQQLASLRLSSTEIMPCFLVLTVLLTSLLSPTIGSALRGPHHRHGHEHHVRHNHHVRHMHPQETSPNSVHSTPLLHARGDGDPTDFSWVKRLVAIGDSFTAGIGSGNHLGTVFHDKDSWDCSRYDLSYPMLVNGVIGPSVSDFQFRACSGHRSVQIFEQVGALQQDINMVIMTAGGNDLCLVSQSQPSFLILVVVRYYQDEC